MVKANEPFFLHVICFTKNGLAMAEKLYGNAPKEVCSITFCSRNAVNEKKQGIPVFCISLDEWVKRHFMKGNVLLYIGACGIAVRSIAPYIHHKDTDAAVIVMDECGRFVIPVLSGHIGGANEWAEKISLWVGGTPVLTTASDVQHLFAVDVFARKNNLFIRNLEQVKVFSSMLLETRKAAIIVDDAGAFTGTMSVSARNKPEELSILHTLKDVTSKDVTSNIPVCVLSAYERPQCGVCTVQLVPKNLVVGIGCKKGKPYAQLKAFVETVFEAHNLSMHALSALASIDLKKEEDCLVSLARQLSVPFLTFSVSELNAVQASCSSSDFVRRVTGVDNVCERSVFAAQCSSVIVPKTVCKGMTLCVGIKNMTCTWET